MKKSIYKITNKINGKCYIGQTTDPKRRFQEHKALGYGQEENKLLYKAFTKYGLENFTFEVIESNIENYNEREIYWIDYYQAQTNGYNMTLGGEEPPVKYGENHQLATHTQTEVNKVVDLLLNSTLSPDEIAQQTNYDTTSILRINRGVLWHKDTLTYPLRPTSTKDFYKDRSLAIIDDLMNTTMTQKEIGQKYGLGRTAITAINVGKNAHRDDINYPIRDSKNNQHSKTIYMYDKQGNFVKEFESAIEAARYLGNESWRAAIQLCASGQTKTSHGYIWKYEKK